MAAYLLVDIKGTDPVSYEEYKQLTPFFENICWKISRSWSFKRNTGKGNRYLID